MEHLVPLAQTESTEEQELLLVGTRRQTLGLELPTHSSLEGASGVVEIRVLHQTIGQNVDLAVPLQKTVQRVDLVPLFQIVQQMNWVLHLIVKVDLAVFPQNIVPEVRLGLPPLIIIVVVGFVLLQIILEVDLVLLLKAQEALVPHLLMDGEVLVLCQVMIVLGVGILLRLRCSKRKSCGLDLLKLLGQDALMFFL